MNAEPQIMTVNQAAGLLQVSRASIYKLIGQRRLKAVRIGSVKNWRIARTQILKLCDGKPEGK